MRRVIGMDIHRTFAEVVFWQDGRLRWHGRIDMTRSGLEGFGRSLIERSAAYQLDGRAWLEFRSEGVQCRIEAPLKAHPDG